MSNPAVDEKYEALRHRLAGTLSGDGRLAVVKAPPGSGKTHTLLEVVSRLVGDGARIAIGAQTNNQASDIARRIGKQHPRMRCVRLASQSAAPPTDLPPNVTWLTTPRDIPTTPGVTVSTVSKWQVSKDMGEFDLFAVDEAWQLGWASFMQCAVLSEKFLMIGDPGQIPPLVPVPALRWDTAPRPPHLAAPEIVLGDEDLVAQALVDSLPACRRLPYESVDFVKPFYDFDFDAYAMPGARKVTTTADDQRPGVSALLRALDDGKPVVGTRSTPDRGLTGQADPVLAREVHTLVQHLTAAGSRVTIDDAAPRQLTPTDIGVCATHRAMVGEIHRQLGDQFAGVRVDTPERWQGLERPMMVIIHPLSGVMDPTPFDIETGRLCVMASRHQAGLIILARDHVEASIMEFIPTAAHAPGGVDVVGIGHAAHRKFWSALRDQGRIFELGEA